jgi:hypothetical protein
MRFLSLLFVASLLLAACGDTAKTTEAAEIVLPSMCSYGETPSCLADLADPAIVPVAKNMFGVWKWMRTTTKGWSGTSVYSSYDRTDKVSYCFSPDGGVRIFQNKSMVCAFCYNIAADSTGKTNIEVLNMPAGFCETQLASGSLTFAGDSMMISGPVTYKDSKGGQGQAEATYVFKKDLLAQ